MSYRYPIQPVGFYRPGLGQASVEQRFDRTWDLLCFPAGLPAPRGGELRTVLDSLYGTSRSAGWTQEGTVSYAEGANPIAGLKLVWIRMGKQSPYWPGAGGEYNFGPNTYLESCPAGTADVQVKKPANAIRINRAFYSMLKQRASVAVAQRSSVPFPPALWHPHSDGYVRLRVDDPLLEMLRTRVLIPGGYMPANEQVSTKDESAFVRGLHRAYVEWREQLKPNPNLFVVAGRTQNGWPGGTNFGPNTAGNELRIHPATLSYLLNQRNSRAVIEQRKASVLRDIKIKPMVVGGLPSLMPKRPTWRSPRALPVPQLRVTAAERTAATTTTTGTPSVTMTAEMAREMLRRAGAGS